MLYNRRLQINIVTSLAYSVGFVSIEEIIKKLTITKDEAIVNLNYLEDIKFVVRNEQNQYRIHANAIVTAPFTDDLIKPSECPFVDFQAKI